jgi:hypothetical protein
MSVVSLLGVNVLNNPAKFGDSYQFEITFECLEPLQKGMQFYTGNKLLQMLICVIRPRMEVDLRWICYLVRPSLLLRIIHANINQG